MDARKLLGPVLLVLLLGGIGGGIYYSAGDRQAASQQRLEAAAMVDVKGLAGSEKMGFLQDPRVAAALAQGHLRLAVRKEGSREMAMSPELKQQDFVFPAGAPGANKAKQVAGVKQDFTPFYTVMAVASWRPIADLLVRNGVARKQGEGWYTLDLARLVGWMKEGRRWKDVPGNTAYPVNKSILVSTTDVRTSNSAAMYLALVSYVLNNGEVVASDEAVARVAPVVQPMFSKQGYQESSSAGPFDDYVSMGMGKEPLVMVYEAQFIEYLARTPVAKRNPDMVLLYPSPTVFTKHTLVPLNERGAHLGQLLVEQPGLQELAAEYGLRVADGAMFNELQAARGIRVPQTLVDVIDPPAFEWMEKLIDAAQQP